MTWMSSAARLPSHRLRVCCGRTARQSHPGTGPAVIVAMRFHRWARVWLKPGRQRGSLRQCGHHCQTISITVPVPLGHGCCRHRLPRMRMPPPMLRRPCGGVGGVATRAVASLAPAPHALQQWNASGIAVAAAVNSSFYALLSISTTGRWVGNVPRWASNSAYEGHTFWIWNNGTTPPWCHCTRSWASE